MGRRESDFDSSHSKGRISGEKCYKCSYCGKEFTDDLKIFCVLPDRPPSENICWCVCDNCREEFLKKSREKRSKIFRREEDD
jgi:hypothetical protein